MQQHLIKIANVWDEPLPVDTAALGLESPLQDLDKFMISRSTFSKSNNAMKKCPYIAMRQKRQ